MKITAKNITKRFENEWIVKDFSYSFTPGSKTAIVGNNGSGKSTLLKVLTGLMLPNKGAVIYERDEKVIAPEEAVPYLSFCSPAQELIEEFSLLELLKFHFKFRKPYEGASVEQMLEEMYFHDSRKKLIKHFSSGMKQRLKLGLAVFTDASVVMLDEPTTNMDETGIKWYRDKILKLLDGRSVIISSNQNHEYEFCENHIRLQDFKPYAKNS